MKLIFRGLSLLLGTAALSLGSCLPDPPAATPPVRPSDRGTGGASGKQPSTPPQPTKPAQTPAESGTPAPAGDTTAPKLTRPGIFLWSTSAGWPKAWTAFDEVWSGWTDPAKPEAGADPRYYFQKLARRAAQMKVDGVIFTTPGVPLASTDPDAWRMPMEGRVIAARHGSKVGDEKLIADGLKILRERFSGVIILYSGYPDDRNPALVRDPHACDEYVKASLGAYLSTGYISYLIVDTVGAYGDRECCKAVLSSIHRLYPKVPVGGEPHPSVALADSYKCSLTTRQLVKTVDVFGARGAPLSRMDGPVIVGYNEAERIDLQDALRQLKMGHSVGIQDWTAGYLKELPTDADKKAWEDFLAAARAEQAKSPPPRK